MAVMEEDTAFSRLLADAACEYRQGTWNDYGGTTNRADYEARADAYAADSRPSSASVDKDVLAASNWGEGDGMTALHGPATVTTIQRIEKLSHEAATVTIRAGRGPSPSEVRQPVGPVLPHEANEKGRPSLRAHKTHLERWIWIREKAAR